MAEFILNATMPARLAEKVRRKCRGYTVTLALLCMFLLASCSGTYEPKDRHKLEEEFSAEFGFSPPPQISDLRCKEVAIGDTWSKWMAFTNDPPLVQRILTEGFTNAGPDVLSHPWTALWSQELTSHNLNSPSWWKTPTNTDVKVYFKTGDRRDYAGYTYLWIDEPFKTVYVEIVAWH